MSQAQDYRRAIADYIRTQAQPPDKFSHQPRLYELARSLADGRAYDDDVLYAAAWLHDLGVFVGHRPEEPAKLAAWDHVAYAVRVVPPLLEQFGFPTAKTARVLEAIRNHLPSAQPTMIEGVLLRDADLLEQLGAIGILRIVSKVGRDTRFPTHADAVRVLRRHAEELPAGLISASARRLAVPRVATMEAFFRALETESAGAML
jgi:uncharacterized protein